jgi:hypothetical protein
VSERSDNAYEEARRYNPALTQFLDEVYGAMPDGDRDLLSSDHNTLIEEVISYALKALPTFGEALAQLVAEQYRQSPSAGRFVPDKTRWQGDTPFLVFLDEDSQLVTVRRPELTRTETDEDGPSEVELGSYLSYEVLTGPLAGERFHASVRPLPSEPVYRPGAVGGTFSRAAANPQPGEQQPDRGRVFLCHASEDKPAVRTLYQRLKAAGFRPWLDEEDLIPGQDWDREIRRAVRAAQVVLVCLSTRSEKRGYVQKEIRRALDVADEQPEGTIFLIPVRLEECAVPERLRTWHWVDLHSENGYSKLEVALESAVREFDDSAT